MLQLAQKPLRCFQKGRHEGRCRVASHSDAGAPHADSAHRVRRAASPRVSAVSHSDSPPACAAVALPRRSALGAFCALVAATLYPGEARANLLDDLLAAKRKTNAKFLVGPIQLARMRLADAQKLAAPEAAALVNKAALDCLDIESGNLRAYSAVREVCTFRIVARSVTEGPAAEHAAGSAEATEMRAAVGAVVEGFRALEESLGEGLESGARYQALGTALTRFEDAVLASLRVTRESLRA